MDELGAPFAHPAFVHLQREIAIHGPAIDAALDSGLSQGLVEAPYLPVSMGSSLVRGSRLDLVRDS